MGENSAIEWCDHTFNPWIGCQAVSPACEHCYAEAWVNGRLRADFSQRRRTVADNWRKPLRWNRMAEAAGVRARVFCASLADVFDNQVPEEWRTDLWDLIQHTEHLDWLLLTKRPQNIAKMIPQPATGWANPGWPWPNVWLGTTVENQTEADRRIPHLLRVPAAKRFLSCEPLLGPLRLHWCGLPANCSGVLDALRGESWIEEWWDNEGKDRRRKVVRTWPGKIDWVIAGGESGPGARPSHPDWHRSLRDQCVEAGVPFFFKQWGEWRPISEGPAEWYADLYRPNRLAKVGESQDALCDAFGRHCIVRQASIHHDGRATGITEGGAWQAGSGAMLTFKIGKKAAGAILDGREHRELPHA